MNYHMHILPTCNCSVQMRLLPFIFIFKLSKTDEVTETIDPITIQCPPFTVFIFMPSKKTHLLCFNFSPEATSTVIVEWTSSGIRFPGFEYPTTSKQVGTGQITYICLTVSLSVKWG